MNHIKRKTSHEILSFGILIIYIMCFSIILTACGKKEKTETIEEETLQDIEVMETESESEQFESPGEEESQKNTDMTLEEALEYEMLNNVDNYHIYESLQIQAVNQEDAEWTAPFFYYADAAVDKKDGKMWIERIGGSDGFECYYEYDLKNNKKDCVKYSENFEPIYKSASDVPPADEYMLQNCFIEDVWDYFDNFTEKYDAEYSISDTLEPVFFNSFEGYTDEGPCYAVTIKCNTDALEKDMSLPEGSLKNSIIKAYISRDTENFEVRISSTLPVFTNEQAKAFRSIYFCGDDLLKKETQFSYVFAFTDINRVTLDYYAKDSGSYFPEKIVYEEKEGGNE